MEAKDGRQFSLRLVVFFVTICAVIAGLSRGSLAAIPVLAMLCWLAYDNGRKIREANRD